MGLNENIASAVSRNLQWMKTMKQPHGYAGPVTHYWSNSLTYTGPGIDWRYEGLIASFLLLEEKTADVHFFRLAEEAGNCIVAAQQANGSFSNSRFEANPGFGIPGTPHESAAVMGLLKLVEARKKKKMSVEPYFSAALKNVEGMLIPFFYHLEKQTFSQFPHYLTTGKSNLFVPNKIATIIEVLLSLYSLTKNNKYLKLAVASGDYILTLQDTQTFHGGIYQSDVRQKIIPFYTARCIPALLELHRVTRNDSFLHAAIEAGKYISTHALESNWFGFGEARVGEEWTSTPCPAFNAGAGDILRALEELSPHQKFSTTASLKTLLKSQTLQGNFPTAIGLTQRNTPHALPAMRAWSDQLGVVGWNDKALRFLAMQLEQDTSLPLEQTQPVSIPCSDAQFIENNEYIRAEGDFSYTWKKTESFASTPTVPLRKLFYTMANTPILPIKKIGKLGWSALK